MLGLRANNVGSLRSRKRRALPSGVSGIHSERRMHDGSNQPFLITLHTAIMVLQHPLANLGSGDTRSLSMEAIPGMFRRKGETSGAASGRFGTVENHCGGASAGSVLDACSQPAWTDGDMCCPPRRWRITVADFRSRRASSGVPGDEEPRGGVAGSADHARRVDLAVARTLQGRQGGRVRLPDGTGYEPELLHGLSPGQGAGMVRGNPPLAKTLHDGLHRRSSGNDTLFSRTAGASAPPHEKGLPPKGVRDVTHKFM